MLLSNIILLKWTSVLLSFHVRTGGEERVAVCDVAHKTNPTLRGRLFLTKQVASSLHRPAALHEYLHCASRHSPPGSWSLGAEDGITLRTCSVSQNKYVLKC